jgi:hypothetical protein
MLIMQRIKSFLNLKFLISLILLLGLFSLWTYKGIFETGIHVDLARDLHELSNLWIHRIVWLGPMTSANFPTSPVYYYLLFPGLLLSNGNALSLIFSQALFALTALGVFTYFQLKRSFTSALLIILIIGLSPWWINAAGHPWNGYMYVSWVFLALTSLWFKGPGFITALLFGISIAIEPAAILALPILFYGWLTNANRKKNLFHIFLGLLLPWTPIFIFEIITQGFLTRHWLAYPSAAGISFSPKITNIYPVLNIIGVSPVQATVILITSFLLATKKARYWLVFACLPLIFLIAVTPLRQYYLLGLICLLVFTVAVILSSKTIGKIILLIFIVFYIQTIKLPPASFTGRSIPTLSNTVDAFIQKSNLDRTKKYAVVSIRDQQNSTQQADDYRFFLRTKGIEALNIDQYPEADILLLFIEVPSFKWQNFEEWHMQRFGNRKFLSNYKINNTEIVIYGR